MKKKKQLKKEAAAAKKAQAQRDTAMGILEACKIEELMEMDVSVLSKALGKMGVHEARRSTSSAAWAWVVRAMGRE